MAEPPRCLACGVFRAELDELLRRGRLALEVEYLDSMLHMRPEALGRALEAGLEGRRPALLLYGDCHSGMVEMARKPGVARVSGVNCCEILLGPAAYRGLQREGAFLFLPEWTLRWREVFSLHLGFREAETARAFMQEHRKRLVYLDTGVRPAPEILLREISDYFAMPVASLPTPLDRLAAELDRAIGSLEGGNHGR